MWLPVHSPNIRKAKGGEATPGREQLPSHTAEGRRETARANWQQRNALGPRIKRLGDGRRESDDSDPRRAPRPKSPLKRTASTRQRQRGADYASKNSFLSSRPGSRWSSIGGRKHSPNPFSYESQLRLTKRYSPLKLKTRARAYTAPSEMSRSERRKKQKRKSRRKRNLSNPVSIQPGELPIQSQTTNQQTSQLDALRRVKSADRIYQQYIHNPVVAFQESVAAAVAKATILTPHRAPATSKAPKDIEPTTPPASDKGQTDGAVTVLKATSPKKGAMDSIAEVELMETAMISDDEEEEELSPPLKPHERRLSPKQSPTNRNLQRRTSPKAVNMKMRNAEDQKPGIIKQTDANNNNLQPKPGGKEGSEVQPDSRLNQILKSRRADNMSLDLGDQSWEIQFPDLPTGHTPQASNSSTTNSNSALNSKSGSKTSSSLVLPPGKWQCEVCGTVNEDHGTMSIAQLAQERCWYCEAPYKTPAQTPTASHAPSIANSQMDYNTNLEPPHEGYGSKAPSTISTLSYAPSGVSSTMYIDADTRNASEVGIPAFPQGDRGGKTIVDPNGGRKDSDMPQSGLDAFRLQQIEENHLLLDPRPSGKLGKLKDYTVGDRVKIKRDHTHVNHKGVIVQVLPDGSYYVQLDNPKLTVQCPARTVVRLRKKTKNATPGEQAVEEENYAQAAGARGNNRKTRSTE